jgi:hypothetical protein
LARHGAGQAALEEGLAHADDGADTDLEGIANLGILPGRATGSGICLEQDPGMRLGGRRQRPGGDEVLEVLALGGRQRHLILFIHGGPPE